jgi:Protein of unknown function (DUF2510)
VQARNYHRGRRYRLPFYLHERPVLSDPIQAPGGYQTPAPYSQPGPQQPGQYQPGPQQQPAPYQQPGQYQQSGPAGYPNSEPLFHIGLLKHTGAVIFWQQQTVRYTGTLQQCEQAYRDAQTHCLLAGWWSLASILVFNWIALFSNMSAIRKIRNLARDPQSYTPQQPAVPQFQPHQQPAFAPQQSAIPAAFAPQQSAIPPGWFPDPSGEPGHRYWDGTSWTHWTNPPAHR